MSTISDSQSEFVRVIQQAVLPLLHGDPAGMIAIGTAFVINASGKVAILMTAKHNLEHVHGILHPYLTYHPSTPEIFRVQRPKHIQLARGQAQLYLPIPGAMDAGRPAMANVVAGIGAEGTDIAYLVAVIPDDYVVTFQYQINLDPAPLSIGEELIAAGYNQMTLTHSEAENGMPKAALSLGYTQREGMVLSRRFDTVGLTPWPIAKTNIPFSSGMSGGPLLSRMRWFDALTARAVICADMSETATNMTAGSGHSSTVSEIWPSLIAPLTVRDEVTGITAERSVLAMIDLGLIRSDKAALSEFVYLSRIDTRERVLHWGPSDLWLPNPK